MAGKSREQKKNLHFLIMEVIYSSIEISFDCQKRFKLDIFQIDFFSYQVVVCRKCSQFYIRMYWLGDVAYNKPSEKFAEKQVRWNPSLVLTMDSVTFFFL